MENIATKFKSLTSKFGDVCKTMHFPCSDPLHWNNFDYFYQGTWHNHPKTTAKTSTSYLNSLMNYDYKKQAHPPYILEHTSTNVYLTIAM